jgi:hypothetical protein
MLQPVVRQVTSQALELSHETPQLEADLPSTSQLGAPLQETEQPLPGSQARLQSLSAVHTHESPLHTWSVPGGGDRHREDHKEQGHEAEARAVRHGRSPKGCA